MLGHFRAVNSIDPAELPIELRSVVEMELRSGERIAWLNQPDPGRMTRRAWPLFLFAIPWTAFAFFWTGAAAWGVSRLQNAGPWVFLFPMFGVPFILVGIALLLSPYWVRRSARMTAYAVTDSRAILFQGGWRGSVSVRSFEPAQLADLQRRQRPDGSGDLVFAREFRNGPKGNRYLSEVGFLGIRDVKEVEDLVRGMVSRRRG